MDLNHLIGLGVAPRETAAFAPVAAESPARDAAGDPSARVSAPESGREDSFTLSARGRAAALEQPGAVQNDDSRADMREEELDSRDQDPAGRGEDHRRNDPDAGRENELTDDEQRMVEELRRTDQQVRSHEQAHVAAGATNARYEYQTGPDGKRYAVGGHADIEVAAMSDDPAGKMEQARRMRAAALAPSDPSTQDLAVASRATRLEMEARREKADDDLEQMIQQAEARPGRDLADLL